MATASAHNLSVQENFGKGKYAKALVGAGLRTNGSCVTRPGSKLIEQVIVPAMRDPSKQVLTSKHVHEIAQTEDYFRGRYHPKLTSLPMQYGEHKPPCNVLLNYSTIGQM